MTSTPTMALPTHSSLILPVLRGCACMRFVAKLMNLLYEPGHACHLSTGPRPARPPPPHFDWPTPHFYRPDPLLLLARPLASISQVRPRLATPCRTVSGCVGTVPDCAVPSWAVSPCRLDTGTSLICEGLGPCPRSAMISPKPGVVASHEFSR